MKTETFKKWFFLIITIGSLFVVKSICSTDYKPEYSQNEYTGTATITGSLGQSTYNIPVVGCPFTPTNYSVTLNTTTLTLAHNETNMTQTGFTITFSGVPPLTTLTLKYTAFRY